MFSFGLLYVFIFVQLVLKMQSMCLICTDRRRIFHYALQENPGDITPCKTTYLISGQQVQNRILIRAHLFRKIYSGVLNKSVGKMCRIKAVVGHVGSKLIIAAAV